MELTNKAYNSVEVGNEGLAFRYTNTFRYRNSTEVEKNLNDFYVLRSGSNIAGAVMGEVDENLNMVKIGPLAVDPAYQVRTRLKGLIV